MTNEQNKSPPRYALHELALFLLGFLVVLLLTAATFMLLPLFDARAHASNPPIGSGGSCSGATISDPVASTQGQQQAFNNALYTDVGEQTNRKSASYQAAIYVRNTCACFDFALCSLSCLRQCHRHR